MIEQWRSQLHEHSGNLTTNQSMPEVLIDQILEEDESLKEQLSLEEIHFPKLEGKLDTVEGLHIIAGLQQQSRDGYMTVFRGVRFPTYKRMYNLVHERGFSISNYEQARILALYENPDYIEKRNVLKSDPRFWTQPQERVVPGLPVFTLANDALQIHRAFRGIDDLAALCAIHIPHELIESRKVTLVTNTAIDINSDTNERDFEIHDFKNTNGKLEIDQDALRARGIDLYEMYARNLPYNLKEMKEQGIDQECFLLNISQITERARLNELFGDTQLLIDNEWFLHGLFGDQNIFGRRKTEHLPYKCQSIKQRG